MPEYDIEETIALDLGTSNSCCYYSKEGHIHILQSENGEYTIPSVLRFMDDGILIGRLAKQHIGKPDTAFELKRILGRKYDDPVVQECIKSWSFTVEPNEKGLPVAVLKSDNMTFDITPSDFYTYLIRHFKEQVEKKIERKVKSIILTVPAYFGEYQRRETISAAKTADLDVVYLMNEPTAAAIAYACENDLRNKTILIYDLGGGTFDVSILRVTNSFDVIATSGDAHLGGIDFTNRLYEWLLDSIKEEVGEIELTEKMIASLRAQAEEAKLGLSINEYHEIDLSDLNIELSTIGVTREDFNLATEDLVERSTVVVKDCLSQAGMIPKDIDEVIMIGGSSRIPAVRDAMTSFFGGREVKATINPDEAVARGAMCFVCQKAGHNMVCGMNDITYGVISAVDPSTIQTDIIPLSERSSYPFNSVVVPDYANEITVDIHDISPMQYVVKLPNDEVDIVVPKGARLPFKKITRYQTIVDYQEMITLDIAQGNSMKYSENDEYQQLVFDTIPRKPKGEVKVDLTVTVDPFCQVSFKAFCNNVPARPTILKNRGSTAKERKETQAMMKNNDRLQSRNLCSQKINELKERLDELMSTDPNIGQYYQSVVDWFNNTPDAPIEDYLSTINYIDIALHPLLNVCKKHIIVLSLSCNNVYITILQTQVDEMFFGRYTKSTYTQMKVRCLIIISIHYTYLKERSRTTFTSIMLFSHTSNHSKVYQSHQEECDLISCSQHIFTIIAQTYCIQLTVHLFLKQLLS